MKLIRKSHFLEKSIFIGSESTNRILRQTVTRFELPAPDYVWGTTFSKTRFSLVSGWPMGFRAKLSPDSNSQGLITKSHLALKRKSTFPRLFKNAASWLVGQTYKHFLFARPFLSEKEIINWCWKHGGAWLTQQRQSTTESFCNRLNVVTQCFEQFVIVNTVCPCSYSYHVLLIVFIHIQKRFTSGFLFTLAYLRKISYYRIWWSVIRNARLKPDIFCCVAKKFACIFHNKSYWNPKFALYFEILYA